MKLEKLWINLRSSLWFVPAAMILAAIALAFGLVEIDSRVAPALARRMPGVFGVGAEGARGILLAISTSTITVAGVIFSITIVALSVASNQYTPRILRNFMRDPGTQLVLGVFVAVFAYSLIVMRTIRGGQEPFVPAIAVAFAILLALISVGVLVYFIHHIAAALQAPTVIQSIAFETIRATQEMFPSTPAEQPPMPVEWDARPWAAVSCNHTGYIQTIARDLAQVAARNSLVVRVERRIGEFVIAGTPLLSVLSGGPVEQRTREKLLRCIALDSFRTVEQDPSYGIRELVDIAMKALSPGINDTSTAVNSIDYLGAILHELLQREPMPNRVAYKGALRVIHARPLTAEKLIDEALLQPRQSGRGNPAVILRLLKVIGDLRLVARPEYLSLLDVHLNLLEEITSQSVASERDRAVISARLRSIKESPGTGRAAAGKP